MNILSDCIGGNMGKENEEWMDCHERCVAWMIAKFRFIVRISLALTKDKTSL